MISPKGRGERKAFTVTAVGILAIIIILATLPKCVTENNELNVGGGTSFVREMDQRWETSCWYRRHASETVACILALILVYIVTRA